MRSLANVAQAVARPVGRSVGERWGALGRSAGRTPFLNYFKTFLTCFLVLSIFVIVYLSDYRPWYFRADQGISAVVPLAGSLFVFGNQDWDDGAGESNQERFFFK